MKISKVSITTFRHLSNLNFDFGSTLTVIAGGNGTGKTSILGLIGHIFKFGNTSHNLFNGRFETKYSSVFRFSSQHDTGNSYHYKITFTDNSEKEAQFRETNENGRIRHRIDVGGRKRHGGKILKPVIFLSLKRLIPLAQENERNIRLGMQTLTPELATEYNELYNEIFSANEIISPVHTISNNKNSFSPTTSNFDAHGISAGQDNIGQIILALLSFKQLKQNDPNYEDGLLLIDELDATLYPAAQKNLLKVMLRIGRELDVQIVFTTHSSDLLNFLSSRTGSQFKHHTNFVSLTNSLGSVTATQGFRELTILLADLNHEALREIKPKKINFYFEDYEACCFFKGIVEGVDFGCENSYKNLSISCGTYKTLIDKGFEEFFRSVVVLDGDFKSSFSQTQTNNVVFLPGTVRPENIVKDFLASLPEDDAFWDNTFRYTKRVFLDNINGVADNRDAMKRWFNSQIEFWGVDASSLFKRWKELNPVDAQEVITRTTEIITRIVDNFYDLATQN
ncbi:ATP-dependent nuclease [Flavobacterium sp.]|uniref:ATP-dependent nuclease n=1 Tax=Flavobacterium sp. TaxID=239 RepID=UPI003B9D7BAC